jgi:4-amino-4-deoxy-L-arabinose transferase-like glycosyltransferase
MLQVPRPGEVVIHNHPSGVLSPSDADLQVASALGNNGVGVCIVNNAVSAIYVVVASLAILWLFCLNIVLGRSRLEAFLAAAILACSWELAYHSRWIAPDAVMMQFALLSFLCLALGMTRSKLHWLYAGAVALGLTIGTKYPGALALPVFLVGAGHTLWRQKHSLSFLVGRCAALAGIAGLTFLLTSPGVLLDPFRFFTQLSEQQETYAFGWYGYTVSPGVPHFLAILQYFGLQLFSHYWALSVALSFFCVLGLISLLLERRLFSWLAAGFVLIYLVFFSLQAAMLVRNLLVVVPVLCLAVSRGVTLTAERLHSGRKYLLYAAVGAVLIVNLGWEIHAASEIKKRESPEYLLKKFEDFLHDSPTDTFLVSEELAKALDAFRAPAPGNVVTNPEAPHTKVAFFQSEGPIFFWETWPSNRWGIYEKVFAPLEVNIEAYPTFVGNQRILLMTTKNFKTLPIHEWDLASPLVLSKAEVVAGIDSYTLAIRSLPGSAVTIRYSVDGADPEVFSTNLDYKGEATFDVGKSTRKGRYQILAFHREGETIWHSARATIVVKPEPISP